MARREAVCDRFGALARRVVRSGMATPGPGGSPGKRPRGRAGRRCSQSVDADREAIDAAGGAGDDQAAGGGGAAVVNTFRATRVTAHLCRTGGTLEHASRSRGTHRRRRRSSYDRTADTVTVDPDEVGRRASNAVATVGVATATTVSPGTAALGCRATVATGGPCAPGASRTVGEECTGPRGCRKVRCGAWCRG